MIWALLLIPLTFAYPISQYTGGDVVVRPGESITLELPAVIDINCLPMAILRVEGGEDYPTIKVENSTVSGEGVYRVLIEGNILRMEINSSGLSVIKGNSEVLCSKDPFVDIELLLSTPFRFGGYNYVSVLLRNFGYSDAEVNLDLSFHTNIAPFHPPPDSIKVPARSKVAHNMFVLAAPFSLKKSAYPRNCIEYRDSVSLVKKCYGPVPVSFEARPVAKCIDNICYSVSYTSFKGIDPAEDVNVDEVPFYVERVYTTKRVSGEPPYNMEWVGLGVIVLATLIIVLVYAGFI